MISCAYGIFCCMMKEFTVGMFTSLLPFTMSVGCLIVFRFVGPLLLDAPIANRFDLGGRHLVVHFGIAALLPKMRALQERPSRRLARRGRTEFDRELLSGGSWGWAPKSRLVAWAINSIS